MQHESAPSAPDLVQPVTELLTCWCAGDESALAQLDPDATP